MYHTHIHTYSYKHFIQGVSENLMSSHFEMAANIWNVSKSKVGDLSRGWPKGSLSNSYYTEV